MRNETFLGYYRHTETAIISAVYSAGTESDDNVRVSCGLMTVNLSHEDFVGSLSIGLMTRND